MVRKAYVLVMVLTFFSLPMNLLGAESAFVELAGLQVVGVGYGQNGTELRAFHQPSGVSLALAIHSPKDKRIVEIDDSKCLLASFTDDRGKNLLDGVDWDGFPKISKDGEYALAEVTSKSRPSQNTSRLFAKGSINLRVASSERTERIENLKLEVGAKVNVRQDVIEVMKVQQENEGLRLVLQVSRKFMKSMKDIRFNTPTGVPVDIGGRGSFSFGNASQLEYYLDLNTTPDSLITEIDIWEELESLNLAFKIDSGVGF